MGAGELLCLFLAVPNGFLVSGRRAPVGPGAKPKKQSGTTKNKFSSNKWASGGKGAGEFVVFHGCHNGFLVSGRRALVGPGAKPKKLSGTQKSTNNKQNQCSSNQWASGAKGA